MQTGKLLVTDINGGLTMISARNKSTHNGQVIGTYLGEILDIKSNKTKPFVYIK